ncbi:ATP-binding protein [Prevotella sp. OH937_COT-195]|uniref:ATP-binding protein n=1 Tax=Prevotella sp. OH937_COT-195 TaxID=2491051 RepID=UPI000F64F1F1|nr:ATP-binding protein [Prevotella sp. OH937_COT-195]RRD02536.1 ATP-binding protein [Prevotella sp. OH937_COT-195]
MKRRAFKQLKAWKESKNRKPLILLGARQVGKTWLMKEFGEKCYDSVAYVNCDAEPLAKSLFVDDYGIERILFAVQAITGVKPEPCKTLIVFDEIQEAPRGLHSLKYFQENAPEYHVMAAGSLLGITLHKGDSFPVGKVDMLSVHPMDFEEFLEANGEYALSRLLHQGDWEMIDIFAPKFIEQLRYYYFVGGMPEVVSHFIENHDLAEMRRLQRNILEAYRNDISKHSSKSESVRIGQVLDSLPSQLAKENKKFIYGVIKQGARAKEYELAIQWLMDAGIIHKVSRVKEILSPVKFYEDMSAFKLFLLDCGLFACMVDAPSKQMLVGDNVFKEFKGAFTEQYVLQQLVAKGFTPYYWSNYKTPAEIDFVIQTEDRVIPIEVKAEENVRARSMKNYIDKHSEARLKGLRFSMKRYVDQGWMENVPLYGIINV